jgi:hypothetical protein
VVDLEALHVDELVAWSRLRGRSRLPAPAAGPIQVKGNEELVIWFLLGWNHGSGPTA